MSMLYKIAEAMLTFEALNNEKLQKLCYFAYGWYLTFYGERLFPEKFEAWEQGPVCPELYEKYKWYGKNKIPRVRKEISQIIEDAELEEFLTAVFDAHGRLEEEELLDLACAEEPWLSAFRLLQQGESSVYDDEQIVQWNTRKVLRELNRENASFVYRL